MSSGIQIADWVLQDRLHWASISLQPFAGDTCNDAMYYLRDHPEKISWHHLSSNSDPLAFELLKANPGKIAWDAFSSNEHPEALSMIKQQIKVDPEVLDWRELSCLAGDKEIAEYLQNHPDKIHWEHVSSYGTNQCMPLLRAHPDKIACKQLCANESCDHDMLQLIRDHLATQTTSIDLYIEYLLYNPKATPLLIDLIVQHPRLVPVLAGRLQFTKRVLAEPDGIQWLNKVLAIHVSLIDWMILSQNAHPYAIQVLKQYPHKIDWPALSRNPHPQAIQWLKEQPDRIHWSSLSENPSHDAIALLRDHPDHIDWDCLSGNLYDGPILFDLFRHHADQLDWYAISERYCIFDKPIR